MTSHLPHYATAGTAVALAACGAALFAGLAAAPPPEVEMAGYATSLVGRTASQRLNARLAAEALNGRVVRPGAVFSFNRAVRSWTQDRGYVKAPVSFDGELVRAFGGGVCQTSTTLYNAALLAGLPVLERHNHVFAAHYAPPGQDAAVAQPGIDLRFRNAYHWPIRIEASARGERLEVRLFGARRPSEQVEIVADRLETTRPAHMTRVEQTAAGQPFVRSPGVPGCRVVTYRLFRRAGRVVRRERLSDDTYEAMDRVVQVEE